MNRFAYNLTDVESFEHARVYDQVQPDVLQYEGGCTGTATVFVLITFEQTGADSHEAVLNIQISLKRVLGFMAYCTCPSIYSFQGHCQGQCAGECATRRYYDGYYNYFVCRNVNIRDGGLFQKPL